MQAILVNFYNRILIVAYLRKSLLYYSILVYRRVALSLLYYVSVWSFFDVSFVFILIFWRVLYSNFVA